jgi:hypothetical protein
MAEYISRCTAQHDHRSAGSDMRTPPMPLLSLDWHGTTPPVKAAFILSHTSGTMKDYNAINKLLKCKVDLFFLKIKITIFRQSSYCMFTVSFERQFVSPF